MARSRTLASMRQQVVWRADAVGFEARHEPARVDAELNQSIQAFRRMVSAANVTRFLRSHQTTLPVGATSPHPFGLLDLSAVDPPVVEVYSVLVTLDGSEVRQLHPVNFTALDKFQRCSGLQSARPVAFVTVADTGLGVLPPADKAYPCVVWYLPLLPDLVDDGDEFDGVAGWEDWPIWDVVVKLCNRDQHPNAYQMAVAEREQTWARIRGNVPANRTLATERRDTWGERELDELESSRWWP